MSVLSRQKHEIAENTESLLSEGAANRARARITAATLRNSPSLPRVREEKVLVIKQLLAKGTYDPDKRLDVVLDPLLADLTV
jgi:hypothetical protein